MFHVNDMVVSVSSLAAACTVFAVVAAAWHYTTLKTFKWSALALALSALGSLLLTFALLDRSLNAQLQREAELQLSELAQRIESTISNRQVEARALVTYLADNPNLTQNEYEHYLNRLLVNPELYTNMAAAPDLRIEYIYPVAGNEPALGLYYPNVPGQWPAIQNMLSTGDTILIGPINLAQGGQGFIIHEPVYNAGGLWGIIAGVLPLDRLLGFAGLTDLTRNYQVNIQAWLASQPGIPINVWGSPLEQAPWVKVSTRIPNGTWDISLNPRSPVRIGISTQISVIVIALLATLLAIWVTYLMARDRDQREQAQIAVQTSTFMLDEAQRIGSMGSWIRSSSGTPFTLSPQLAEMLHTGTQVSLSDWMNVIPRKDIRLVSEALHDIMTGRRNEFSIEHRIRTLDGKERIVQHTAEHTVVNSRGDAQAIGTVIDITVKKETEQRLERLAYFDMLTHTPNRYYFKSEVERLLDEHRTRHQKLALLHIDLDHFKVINDSLGHLIGDDVLRITSERIQAALQERDILSRTGGDEFMVALTDIADSDEACMVAARIVEKFHSPMSVQGHEIFNGVSIGIVIFPDQASTYEELYQRSDLALYRSKSSGRGRYHLFSGDLHVDFQRRTNLERAMRGALSNNEFYLAYQPKVSVADQRLVGIEALLRWQSTEFGMVGPDEFIPLAEETGFIVQLGLWVMNQAFKEFSEARLNFDPDLRLSINLSPRQIQHSDLENDIRDALMTYDVPGKNLELEITETFIIRDRAQCEAFMRSMSRVGVGFSLDDFGTGYSNLASLKNLPLTTLKIDKTFVADIELDQDDRTLVNTVIQLGHNLGLIVIAEGVETSGQHSFLKQAGCDEYQGYLFSPAVRMADLIESYGKKVAHF